MLVTRRIEFDYGHRLLNHESKCSHLHGHRGVAEITCESKKLDRVGRVIDFSCIKELVGGWIDRYWDHNMILHEADPLANLNGVHDQIFGSKQPYVMFNDMNPTAENMCFVLFDAARTLLTSLDITVKHIRLYETPNCWADLSEVDYHCRRHNEHPAH